MANPAKSIERRHPLAGSLAAAPQVAVVPAEPAFRVSLRGGAEALGALGKALGLDLPVKPKTSVRKGSRSALWLGPDEWLVIDMDGKDPTAELSGVDALHSAVDVSHRNAAILVSGAGAVATLNAGCPQNLSLAAFPVGACSRTILGKIEIVLWRTSDESFRVECWRSFSDYAFTFLNRAAKDCCA